MKAMIRSFTNKWVIQFFGILALSLLLWFFGALIPFLEADIARLLAILVVVVLWGLNNLRIQLTANRANAAMAEELAAPAAASTQLADAANADVAAIAKNLDAALLTLKKGAGNSGGKNYLYDLPWYVIIGPPGSGKTTALINSGLDFPLADKFGKGAMPGVGGTRHCDWWFTDQAVLLDTAGRYVTQDSHEAVDKAAWLGFLDLLKKHRPRRPVNGVLITMSLSDLLKQTEAERSLHAQAIRQRIDELHTHFGIRFPIYMIFTKADLIAGFNDFFAHLSKEEITQVWGVTFPEEDPSQPLDIAVQVGQDFDALLARINEQLPRRMQEERDLQRRNLIFGFPQRMALLKDSLLSFLQECYGTNRYQSAPYLRGVYFTSGTQEGTPIDRLMGALAQTFKLDRTAAPLLSGKGKSFFITRLLKDVIFEEALIVGLNPRLERVQRLLRQGVYATAALLILVLSGFWLTSYLKNQAALTDVDSRIDQYNTVAQATPNWQSDFSVLLKRLNAMQAVNQVYPEDVPMLMTFGLYQGDKLQPVINETYKDLLQKSFLPLIKMRLEQRLRDKMGNPELLYSLLEVYLMLADSQHFKAELVRPWVAVDWETTFASDTETQAQLLKHLDVLLQLPPAKQTVDERLVSAARQVLNRIPVAQQIYMRIKNEALQNTAQDLKLQDVLGINADRVFATRTGSLAQLSIPYLYTYDGFYQYFLKQSKAQAQESVTGSWVLGDAAKTQAVDSDQLELAIADFYYQDDIKFWDGLLANLKVKAIGSAAQAVEVLEFASAPDSPLRKLLETLNTQTSLTVPPPSPADAADKLKAAGVVKPLDSRTAKLLAAAKSEGLVGQAAKPLGSAVEEHFKDLTALVRGSGGAVPLDRTMEVLAQLYGYMIDLSGTSNVGGVAIEKAKGGGGGDAVAKMKAESAHLPEPLKSMTQTLAAGNQDLIMDSSKSQLKKLWQSEVMPLYQSGIQGRYPFDRGSSKEVALEDFSRFFAQGGILDTFFNANLKAFVDTSGKNWRMIAQNNQAIAVSSSALAQLQAATKIRQLFFAGGATPLVKFTLKPVFLTADVTSFWLNIEGQQSKYSPAEMGKNAAFQWPGTDGSRLVSFGFDTKDGKKLRKDTEGAWAWFRVLELAHIQQTDQDKYMLTFEIDGLQARYELSASSVDNPFSLSGVANLRLPSGL
ncbi:MAG: type VI secretion system membrane subunit TssM [Methylococcaceae bacterium]|nr:type VI secretion system membrane subunit TssM [Methylococcaceae bacterium]